jgi:Ca2+-binding EF-hand superfamily protein
MSRITKLAIAAALPAALLSIAALAQSAAPAASDTHPTFFQHMLKKLDTDGDGKISLAEFQAGASARFKAADTQNAGAVSAAQLASSPQAQKHNLRAATMLVHHLDTASKGYVTEDDFVAEAQKRFAKLDKQGTGSLTAVQLSSSHLGRMQALGAVGTESASASASPRAAARQQFAQAAFAKLDSNGDGVVTQDEFVSAAKAKFQALDTQGTGKVTAQQIATSSTAQQRDLQFAQHEVKKLDTNGDGVVSQSEYLAAAQARFAKLDKNGDGYITADEITPRHWAHQKAASGSTSQ